MAAEPAQNPKAEAKPLRASTVAIERVTTARQRDEFLALPARIYAGDPNFVPPLDMERRDFLDPAKNPFYKHAATELFLARKDGELVGPCLPSSPTTQAPRCCLAPCRPAHRLPFSELEPYRMKDLQQKRNQTVRDLHAAEERMTALQREYERAAESGQRGSGSYTANEAPVNRTQVREISEAARLHKAIQSLDREISDKRRDLARLEPRL